MIKNATTKSNPTLSHSCSPSLFLVVKNPIFRLQIIEFSNSRIEKNHTERFLFAVVVGQMFQVLCALIDFLGELAVC
jgi:hypothetical protein